MIGYPRMPGQENVNVAAIAAATLFGLTGTSRAEAQKKAQYRIHHG
jgi:hypothetical protein